MIKLEDLKNMKLEFRRVLRTETAEEWLIFSDNLSAGTPLPDQTQSRVGHFILLLIPSETGKVFASGTLILEADWDEEAIEELISMLEENTVGRINIEDFAVEVYSATEVGYWSRVISDYSEMGIYGLFLEIRELKEVLNKIEKEVPKILENIIEQNFDKISSIIKSTGDIEAKDKIKEIVISEFEIGINKLLPTIRYRKKKEKHKSN